MPKRIVKLEAGYNCRDLGGYVSQDGRTVKWGRLYRSGSLSHLTKADQAELARRKIVVDCDLRSRHEQDNFPDKLWSGAKLVDAHFYSESGDEEEEAEAAWEKYSGKLPKLSYLAMVYQQNLVAPRTGLVMRKIFKVQYKNLCK
ncbi:tyrosine-protein phosphatase [Lactobacillus delbrueckii subsp. lactis]|nr:tyrosine-protein phosphatase [Lactobacillus delbrueckii]MCD5558579.1 tyrosine-protein phosphatase [Lactobacillus delbrueckii subsp. lactis]